MLFPLLLTAVVSVTSAPSPAHVSEALRAGCKVQQVHTPAGKPVASRPLIRCDRVALARLEELRATDAVAR